MGNLFDPRFIINRFGDGAGRQQLVEQFLTDRQTRANGRQPQTGEVHTRHARQLVGDGFVGAVLGRHVTQRDGNGKAHKTVATEPQNSEEFLYAVQQPQMRRVLMLPLAAGGAAKHDRHRHHLYIKFRIVAMQIQIVVKQLYRLLFGHVITEQTWAVIDKYVTRQGFAVDLQRLQRIGQTELQTFGAQRQQVRLGVVGQHIEDRPRRIQTLFGNGILWNNLTLYQEF